MAIRERLRFHKTISPDFDRIDVEATETSDWLTISMKVGNANNTVAMNIRSEESVRDLHHALTRYLTLLDEARSK